jgi:hypothetical protein
MNRTDRLYALVEDLRATAPRARGACRLAERFEVSVRTIQRDILALQEAGVPIWATPGPAGGEPEEHRLALARNTGLPSVVMPHPTSTGSARAPGCILKQEPSRNR